MKANIILAIVLVLGTICVVFQRQVVIFLFRYCALGKLLDKLGTCFLSGHEKELSKQEERIRNATEEELLAQWLSIVKEHAGNYNEICTVPEKLSENLPEELLKFFAEYDFLDIGGTVILDKKALKQIKVGGTDYIVIGQDAPDSLFVIRADIVNGPTRAEDSSIPRPTRIRPPSSASLLRLTFCLTFIRLTTLRTKSTNFPSIFL